MLFIIGYFQSLWILLHNGPYVTIVLANVLSWYYVIGVVGNMPRYLEIYFGMSASTANIFSGGFQVKYSHMIHEND